MMTTIRTNLNIVAHILFIVLNIVGYYFSITTSIDTLHTVSGWNGTSDYLLELMMNRDSNDWARIFFQDIASFTGTLYDTYGITAIVDVYQPMIEDIITDVIYFMAAIKAAKEAKMATQEQNMEELLNFESIRIENASSNTKVLVVTTNIFVNNKNKHERLIDLIEIIDQPVIFVNKNSIVVYTPKEFVEWLYNVEGPKRRSMFGFNHSMAFNYFDIREPILYFDKLNKLGQLAQYHPIVIRKLNEYKHYVSRVNIANHDQEKFMDFLDDFNRDYEYKFNGDVLYADDSNVFRVAGIPSDTKFRIKRVK